MTSYSFCFGFLIATRFLSENDEISHRFTLLISNFNNKFSHGLKSQFIELLLFLYVSVTFIILSYLNYLNTLIKYFYVIDSLNSISTLRQEILFLNVLRMLILYCFLIVSYSIYYITHNLYYIC